MKKVAIVARFLWCWLATSSSPNYLVSQVWLSTAAVWRTRRPPTPYVERAPISRSVVACEDLQLSASRVETFSWVIDLSLLVSPDIRPILTTATPQRRRLRLC